MDRLARLLLEHPDRVLSGDFRRVQWSGGKVFEASNILHLERFVVGRRYCQRHQAPAIEAPGLSFI